jgi:hypothetical protein
LLARKEIPDQDQNRNPTQEWARSPNEIEHINAVTFRSVMPDWIRHPDPRIYGWIPAFAGMTFCKHVTELANKTP